MPVVIEGETGVGKTALVEMLSKLWNESLLIKWHKQREHIFDTLKLRLGQLSVEEYTVHNNYG